MTAAPSNKPISVSDIKLAILGVLRDTGRAEYKWNLIGSADLPGPSLLEQRLSARFTDELRLLASRCFDELKKEEYVCPQISGFNRDPENWVVITPKGIAGLNSALVGSVDLGYVVPQIGVGKFGVPDHVAFVAELSAQDNSRPMSVAFIDLDNFKSVNDNHDHSVGDLVIRAALEVVDSVIRLKGGLFHRSGDELLVLLPNSIDIEALAVAERIRRAIQEHGFPVIGSGLITATIGIATYPTQCPNIEDLEVNADRAAMAAKKKGKNLVMHALEIESGTTRVQSALSPGGGIHARLVRSLHAELRRNLDVASITGVDRTDFRSVEFDKLDISVLEDLPDPIRAAIESGYGAVSVLQTAARRLDSRTTSPSWADETYPFVMTKSAQLPILTSAVDTLKQYIGFS